MKTQKIIYRLILLIISGISFSCEELVSIDEPTDRLIRNQVFDSEETAVGAMTGIYNELFQSAFSGGSRNSVTVLAGLSSDNVSNISNTNPERMEFQQHEINPANTSNLDLWTGAYNIIYITNSFLEGIEDSETLEPELQMQLEGEARFVRAFTYFNLVILYGDVPLILSTNYQENSLVARTPMETVMMQIEEDLILAEEMLAGDYRNGERTSVNRFAAKALLARFYLHQEDWMQAERLSSEVLEGSALYNLSNELDNVFLANSEEAIWQISPIGGGGIASNTNEGNMFVIDPFFSFFATIKITEDLVAQFEPDDIRLEKWIGYNTSLNAYFNYKYKIQSSTQFPITEYSMVLRLAEQFLIRAEARARQGDLSGAISDIDQIRLRAQLKPLKDLNLNLNQDMLMEEIYQQRRKELFAEWGHRWFDLKRSDRAASVFSSTPSWQSEDLFYPIPEAEIAKNPNLTQNNGY